MERMMIALYEARWMSEAELRAREGKCDRLCIEQDEIRMRLIGMMSEEMKKMFQRYSELEKEINLMQGKTDYAQGFRDGLRMGAWALMQTTDEK